MESVEHTLLKCKCAKEIWRLAPIQCDGLNELRHDFWKWWEKLLEAKSRREGISHIELTANLLWQVWKDINSRIFNKEINESKLVVDTTIQEWIEFDQANRRNADVNMDKTEETVHPESIEHEGDKIKINLEVQITRTIKRVGYCCVARNQRDEIQLVWAHLKCMRQIYQWNKQT